jgi:ferrous iron transport protein B
VRIALVGNPNAGKSSVFNRLTGLQQKVGNFPGVTVDRKSGTMDLGAGGLAQVVDLPGLYSVYPHTPDQAVALDVLLDPSHEDHPDAVVYVADAQDLERHLLLFTQVVDLGFPVWLCLNQADLADKEGTHFRLQELEKAFGVPVFATNGRTGAGLDAVVASLQAAFGESPSGPHPAKPFRPPAQEAAALLSRLPRTESPAAAYRLLLQARHQQRLPKLLEEQRQVLERAVKNSGLDPLDLQVQETMARYDKLGPILAKAVQKTRKGGPKLSAKLDQLLTHPILGTGIFFLVLLLIFQALFAWASVPMDLIDGAFAQLREGLHQILPAGWFSNLLADGLVPGIGGVVIFIPQIALLFLLIGLMEESGYMARAVYLSDTLMRRFGLNGRSFVALISGVACAVPAIMSARSIHNPRERLATIFVTPFMPCSARLPVYVVLIAFAVPDQSVLGGLLNLQGLLLFALYLLGTLVALASAWLVQRFTGGGNSSFLLLELPDYQMPDWRNVAMTVWDKARVFVVDAGKIIVVISMVLWALSSYGPGSAMADARQAVALEQPQLPPDALAEAQEARALRESFAGRMGRAIEPAIEPLGFDWKMGIALITSFAAREVFVGTMATIYGAGSEDVSRLSEAMAADRRPGTGQPVYTSATAISLLLFYAFAMQCMSTLAIVRRETGSWKIPVLQLVYMTGLAYLSSLLAYQLMT